MTLELLAEVAFLRAEVERLRADIDILARRDATYWTQHCDAEREVEALREALRSCESPHWCPKSEVEASDRRVRDETARAALAKVLEAVQHLSPEMAARVLKAAGIVLEVGPT